MGGVGGSLGDIRDPLEAEWLGDNRQFANDTADPPTVDVLEPCTVAAARYDTALAALNRTERRLRHTKRHAKRSRLKQLAARERKAVAADRKAARAACGPGVAW